MASSLYNLVNNLAAGIQKLYLNMNRLIKNVKLAELNTKIATAFLNIKTLKMT